MSSSAVQQPSRRASGAKIRISRAAFDLVRKHLTQNPEVEQFAFALFRTVHTADGVVHIVRDIFLPASDDLEEQRSAGVAPKREFQSTVYLVAAQRGLGILDMHTHTHDGIPSFSSIDEAESRRNAHHICARIPAPATHAMLVFNRMVTAFDGAAYDRGAGAYQRVTGIEILGRGSHIGPPGSLEAPSAHGDEQYDRQRRIPGWNQLGLARQRVAIVGVGGDGAHILQTLVSIGVGTEGWIAVIDPDVVEQSNLPRIPYAWPEHVGHPKATVASCYANRKNPAVRIYPYPCAVSEHAAIERIKAATMLIGAGDNDGLRKVCNLLAVRYQIPYIDLGCDIQVENENVAAGGQVRVVLPGETACLVCCNGYDAGEATLDLMDESESAARAQHGYVRGANAEATPSVANLNATTAQLGVAAFLGLVHGARFGRWAYAHFDQLTAETLVASSRPSENCPLCGVDGIGGTGDDGELEHPRPPVTAELHGQRI